jgi:hypothetical protein
MRKYFCRHLHYSLISVDEKWYQVTTKASKMALRVFAAFRSCFFSLVFFVFGVFLAAPAVFRAATCGDRLAG